MNLLRTSALRLGGFVGRPVARLDREVSKYFRLYGALRKCAPGHWWRAFTEVALTLVFALLPIWVPMLAYPMFGHTNLGIGSIIGEQIKNGELYIIATALLAPIYYFTFPMSRGDDDGRVTPFPSQQVIILLFIGVICISVIAVTAAKVQSAGSNAIPQRMITWSIIIFWTCCLIYLLTLTVRNSLGDLTEAAYDDQSRRQDRDMPPPGKSQAADRSLIDPDALVAETINKHRV